MAVLNEFKEFAVRGNVIDLAVGIIVGGAFNRIVGSLVNDIVMPPVGLLIGKVDFTNLFITLGPGQHETLAGAQAVGAPTLNYGIFINNIIIFVITAFAVFLLVRYINKLRRVLGKTPPPPAPSEKKCPYCATSIPLAATRCPNCTSELIRR